MKCPKCGSTNNKVTDSRDSKLVEAIRRRRECLNCKMRFTTLETHIKSPATENDDIDMCIEQTKAEDLISLIEKKSKSIDQKDTFTYNEKLYEEFIKKYPEQFLSEKMIFDSQQTFLFGFRPDLIFKDNANKLVIVEIQLEALDRSHLYRSLEYRDFLLEKQDSVRIILVCNSIPKRYLKVLRAHNVKCINISKKDFLDKVKKLEPKTVIISGIKSSNFLKNITSEKVLLRLKKNLDIKKADGPNARIFWLRTWNELASDLHFLKKQSLEDEFKREKLHLLLGPSKSETVKVRKITPLQIIICENFLTSIDNKDIEYLEILIKVIERVYIDNWNNNWNEDIILGDTNYEPYKRYTDGFKKLNKRLLFMYDDEKDKFKKFKFNTDKLFKNFTLLGKFKFYLGKYPNLYPIKIFEDFKINKNPGSLSQAIDKHFAESSRLKSIIKNGNILLPEEFISIRLTNISRDFFSVYSEYGGCNHLLAHVNRNTKRFKWNKCNKCVMPSRLLNDLDEEAINLSTKLFAPTHS